MWRSVARIVAVVCALPATALAQSGVNGSILGNVFDQTGNPVKGVKIIAKSDTQIGGPKVTYSNDEGTFRIVGLIPGTFDVTASAPKLKTVIQKDVKVGVGAPAEVNLVMEVETQVEEVKVVEKAPTVSTTTANVKQTYDADFVEGLPTVERWAVESFVGYNTPGVYYQSLRSIRVRGGGTNQNSFNVEGFKMNGQKITTKSLAALEVNTAGYGAENANVPGGVVNMVSKSGSNKYEIDISGWADDSNLRFFQDESDSEAHSLNYYVNPAFSGPIVKDRLWFYLNTEARRQRDGREKDLSGSNVVQEPRPFDYLNTRASLKLTWQATNRLKFSTYSSLNRDMHRNNAGDVYNREQEAQQKTDHFDYFTGIIGEALLSDSLFLRSQVGYQQFWEIREPWRCKEDPVECQHIPQVRNTFPRTLYLQNLDSMEQRITRTVEVINQLEWFVNHKVWGEHNVKLRSRFYGELFESAQATPGDYYLQYNGTTPDRQRIYYANDPRLEPARYGWRIRGTSALTTVHSVSDAVRLTRYFTLTPGLAYTTTRAANVGTQADIDQGALTPHISAAWDATHDGRTVLRASFNQYVDTDSLRLARFALGDRVYRECRWNEETQAFDRECRYGGGSLSRTFGLPCGPSGIDVDGSTCKEELKIPKTYEYTAGAEREIVQGIGLGADLVYRLYTYPYENRETNRVWASAGYSLSPTGEYRNGRNETVDDLGTPAAARRRYLGITGSIHKREGTLKANLGYTWARLEGNVNNNEGNDFGTNPYRDLYYLYGYLPDDSRHTIKASMTYQWTRWFSSGVIYQYISGKPYSRLFRNDVQGNFSDYRASVGVNPGSNLNDPGDDRPLRLSDIQEINLQFRANLRPVTGTNLEGFVDVMNVFALRTTTRVLQNDGPDWGAPDARMRPFRARLGFRWRY